MLPLLFASDPKQRLIWIGQNVTPAQSNEAQKPHSLMTPSSLSRFTFFHYRFLISPRTPKKKKRFAMAISSRLRSGIPLFRRILSASDCSFGNHSVAKFELQGLRNFSSQVKATEAKVKVPLTLFGGSGNYASALFLAASKANILDKVESEIVDVVAASKKSPLFSQFIKDLSVPRGTRVKAIMEIFGEVGFSDVTKNFLAVLADNGRLRNIERIAKRFVDLTMAHKGEVKVVVTTVIPLPEEEERDLKQTLKEILPNAKTVQIEQKIDPSILGGLVIEFGQKVFDMSIKTRASQMEKFLREPLNFDNL